MFCAISKVLNVAKWRCGEVAPQLSAIEET